MKRTTPFGEEWIVYNYVQRKRFCCKRNEPQLYIPKKPALNLCIQCESKIRNRTAIISREMQNIMRTYIKMFKAQYNKDGDTSSNNGWLLVFEYVCLLGWTVISVADACLATLVFVQYSHSLLVAYTATMLNGLQFLAWLIVETKPVRAKTSGHDVK